MHEQTHLKPHLHSAHDTYHGVTGLHHGHEAKWRHGTAFIPANVFKVTSINLHRGLHPDLHLHAYVPWSAHEKIRTRQCTSLKSGR